MEVIEVMKMVTHGRRSKRLGKTIMGTWRILGADNVTYKLVAVMGEAGSGGSALYVGNSDYLKHYRKCST